MREEVFSVALSDWVDAWPGISKSKLMLALCWVHGRTASV